MKKNLLASLALLFLFLPTTAQGYRLNKVTEVQAGEKYVFEQSGRVMIAEIVSSGINTTSDFLTSGLDGTESYVWTLEAPSGSSVYYIKGSNGNYVNNTSSTTITLQSSYKSKWQFEFDEASGTALITNTTNGNRFLGYASTLEYFYKAYQTVSDEYPHQINVYQLVPEDMLTLTGIRIANPPACTTYTEGNTFDPEGMTVVAQYTSADETTHEEEITDYTFSPTRPLTTDDTEITISYASFTATVAITVNAAPQYTVTLGDSETVLAYDDDGNGVTLPARENSDTYTFVGWSETQCDEGITTCPDIIGAGSYLPTHDITLYPIYSMQSEADTEGWTLVSDLTAITTGTYALVVELSDGWHAFNGTLTEKSGTIRGGTTESFSFENGYTATLPDGTAQLTISAGDDGLTIANANGKFLSAGATGSGFLKWESSSSTTWSVDTDFEPAHLRYNDKLLRYSTSTSNPGFCAYYNTSDGTTISLARKTTTVTRYISQPYSITMGTYATLYLEYDATIPEGVEAFIATESTTQGMVTLTPVENAIPACTPVVLKAQAAGTYTLLRSTQEAEPAASNLLHGVSVDTDVNSLLDGFSGKSVYGLRLHDDGTPFFARLIVDEANSGHNVLAAHKAVLVMESAATSIGLRNGDDNGDDTAVTAQERQTSSDLWRGDAEHPLQCYDLSGRPVKTHFRGWVIGNRKITFSR